MACPYMDAGFKENGTDKDNNGELNYSNYLQTEELLSCQHLESKRQTGQAVHDEHLFIVTHQTYELWFKQILVELDSVCELFTEKASKAAMPNKKLSSAEVSSQIQYLDESHTLKVVSRLHRINLILKLLEDQFAVLETLTPLDFMDFRGFLSSASGFQSLQFRMMENKLGLKQEQRVKYNQQHYKDVFHDKSSKAAIEKTCSELSLLDIVQSWLERTPGLEEDGFNFWGKFQYAVHCWLEEDFLKPAQEETDPALKNVKIAEYEKQKSTFQSVFDEDMYNEYVSRGERRLRLQAFKGAMLIYLYRDLPRLHQPFQLLTLLMDIDSNLTKWRYNHVSMVQRMIGSKVGTGGSSGYQYLRSTVSDRYKIFLDLFNLSTFLIPRRYIPALSTEMKQRLSVVETVNSS